MTLEAENIAIFICLPWDRALSFWYGLALEDECRFFFAQPAPKMHAC
jgi:hypothetical protein